MAHNCLWVLASGEHCNKPVKYIMRTDDDGNKVRYYPPFCPEHLLRANEDDTTYTDTNGEES